MCHTEGSSFELAQTLGKVRSATHTRVSLRRLGQRDTARRGAWGVRGPGRGAQGRGAQAGAPARGGGGAAPLQQAGMNAATPTSRQPPLPVTLTLSLSLSLTAQMREQLGKNERERQRQRDEFAQELAIDR